VAARPADEPDLDDLRQQAITAAVKKVAPFTVQIETSGGIDVVRTAPGPMGQMVRTGVGPTTGVIVAADGYVITSAFNFINKPTAIHVAVPGRKERLVATVVATDQTRMLTLLKIDAKDLPTPTPTPKSELKVGYTALAVGRTLSPTVEGSPSVSEGIISAINRIWGKAIQTDAKVSPVNYGGPMVDLTGRVQGILVPASPRADSETAGFEWYDSGIGFAIPLEDVLKALPRLKEGKDLKRGVLGVNMASQDQFGVAPTVSAIQPGSSAEQVGIQINDVIKEIDGVAVASYAQLQHQLGNKYEGDLVDVKVQRGKEEKKFDKVKLGSVVAAFGQAWMGILPMRDDAEKGVEIRYVYPKSPAETAGLKEGDRILKAGRVVNAAAPVQMAELKNRDALLALMDTAAPGVGVRLEVKRKATGKNDTINLKLAALNDEVPDKLPTKSSLESALGKKKKDEKKDDAKKDDKKEEPKKDDAKKDDAKKDEKKEPVKFEDGKKDDEKKDDDKEQTGLFKETTAAGDRTYWIYVPENYDPNISHALVIWLHPIGKGKERDIKDFKLDWQDFCEDQHLIVLAPIAEDASTGWRPGESDSIVGLVKSVTDRYTIDKRRTVVHGMGIGGQMAFYMGFHHRPLVRGVATTGAALGSNPKERLANQPLAFFLVAGAKDPLKEQIQETQAKLKEYKFSSIYTEIEDSGHEYLDFDTLKKLVRWIDSLDRM
jgi:S1-C subfamily serine protease/predicted esterase